MNRIKSWFHQKDKVGHMRAGILISAFFPAISMAYEPLSYSMAVVLGLMMAVLAGAVKEFLDSLGYGQVELDDFLATVFGGLIGAVVATVSYILYLAVFG